VKSNLYSFYVDFDLNIVESCFFTSNLDAKKLIGKDIRAWVYCPPRFSIFFNSVSC